MIAYDMRLQEKAETAEFVVEGRIGVLANDGYEVTYGIPGNAAAALATVFSPMPRARSSSRHAGAFTGAKKPSGWHSESWSLRLRSRDSRARLASRRQARGQRRA